MTKLWQGAGTPRNLTSDFTRMETPAHHSAMDEDEFNFVRYPKAAKRCIKDPIYDQSTVTSFSYTTRSLFSVCFS